MKIIAKLIIASLLLSVAPVLQAATIFLTFDDGPGVGTSMVLDVLAGNLEVQTQDGAPPKLVKAPEVGPKQVAIPATFFVMGRDGVDQGSLFKSVLKAKHAVGNHSFNHIFGNVSASEDAYRNAFGKTGFETPAKKAAFDEFFNKNTKYFAGLIGKADFTFPIARLPGDGRNFDYLKSEIVALGMKHVGWDVEFAPNGTFTEREKPGNHDMTRDWKGLPVAVTKLGTSGVPKDNQVVLFHDHHWTGSKEVVFAQIIAILRAEGYTFSSITP